MIKQSLLYKYNNILIQCTTFCAICQAEKEQLFIDVDFYEDVKVFLLNKT